MLRQRDPAIYDTALLLTMVTSLAIPQKSQRPATKHRAIARQASFDTQPFSNMDASYVSKPGFLAKSYANDSFLSPNAPEMWSTDDESESSSGQDEFHLERYSHDASRQGMPPARPTEKRGKLASRSRRARRPDLNIVTEMPGSQVRAVGSGVVVEQVKAQKAATSRPKSVYSSKAEHVDEPFPPQRVDALMGLKETARLRHEKNKIQRNSGGLHDHPHGSLITTANTSRSRDRSDQKPVLIGITIPREEADAQANAAISDQSAITLRTPSILVTPAVGEAALATSPPRSNRRPISSVYSTAQPSKGGVHKHANIPPLPEMPAAFSNFSRPRAPSDPKQDDSTHVPRGSIDSWEEDEVQDGNHDENPKLSFESQERILPSERGPARPKSQGWWNLMLSPMLSRAGTHKSNTTRKPAESSRPPLPSTGERRLSRSTTVDSQISPETPRRLGMAGARASTWSRWTAWEIQKENPPALPEEAIAKAIRQSQAYQAPRSGQAVPAIIVPAKPTEGLAAEYYRACAIEQLTGESYFECENHSCAEGLPALHSIYDQEVPAQLPGAASDAERGVDAADVGHQRALSLSTDAGSPEELSPNVRQADTASVLRPKALGSDTSVKVTGLQNTKSAPGAVDEWSQSPAPIPMPSPSKLETRYPNIAAIVPPQNGVHAGATVASPGPISPEMQRTMTSQGALPMSEIGTLQETRQHEQSPAQPPAFYNYVNYPQDESRRDAPTNVYFQNREYKPSPEISQMPAREEASEEKAKKEEQEVKPSFFSRLKSCTKSRNSKGSSSRTNPKKRRWAYLIGVVLLLMIIGMVALATQLTRHGDHTPTQQQWLNLTGYPPMPTGISTIIRPDLVKQQDQCVTPNTLWSCSLPKEDQAEVAPNDADQPNFRFEIKFHNGTVPSNTTIPISESDLAEVSKRANDPFTNELFTPNPTPPSRAEQIFLGNTTDNITGPFDGEKTPFFTTFIPAFPVDPNDPTINATSTNTNLEAREIEPLQERQKRNLSSAIPAPSVQDDGSAAPANLLPADPYPFSQPIRLYNRGLQDEHYGFYMYFDRSIFLGSSSPISTHNNTPPRTNIKRQTAAATGNDTNGGALRSQAQARCTFAQTRFLVKIYTNPAFPATLLNGGAGVIEGMNNKSSNSATNYTPPGSFPYPTSISIDRHGGNVNKKLVYCYGVDELQVIDEDVKSVIVERRSVGGTSVNAAPGLVEFEGEEDQDFDESAGGIDGGSGGCECSWQNWN